MSGSETVVGAYGSGRTSGTFDPIAYIKKPEVILRLFGVLFSIIVFACIADKAKGHSRCAFNGNMDACNFGIAIGVISLLGLLLFLAVDAVIDLVSNIQYRKFMVIADVGYSSVWGFMWLVCFIFLTDTWRRTDYKYYVDTVQAAIAFTFFSFLIYVALIILAAIKLRQGIVLSDISTQANQPSAFPPAHAHAQGVYSVGDAPFSPHPFGQGPTPDEIAYKTDSPAY